MVRLFITTLCLMFLVIAPALAEHKGVGSVKVLNGSVDVVRGNIALRLTLGTGIYRGDIIRTSLFGSVGITFLDGTMLSLGPNGEITIDEFLFDPVADEFSFASSLTLGILTYSSGEIAKLRPEAVTISTPLATIGIRGTRFAVSMETP